MSKKVLIVFSGLNIQRNEGAKLRLYSMIDSYISNGYAIDVLIFFPLSSFINEDIYILMTFLYVSHF